MESLRPRLAAPALQRLAHAYQLGEPQLLEDIYEGIYSRDPTPEYYDRWGSDLGNEMRFEKWGAHTLTYGVTVQWENINTQIPLDEDGHPLDNAGYGRIGDRQEFSLFLDWRWKPWKTLTFDAGLRYSKARTDDHKLVIPKGHDEFLYDDDGHVIDTVYVQSVFCVDKNGDGACDPIRYRTNNDGAAPAFSLTYEPWGNGLQFYAQYMQALRLPSLFETTQGWSVVPALDVPLRPEHAYNYELGANLLRRDALFVGDRLTVKLAAFYNLTRNYLTRTSPNEWEEGGQIFVMRNIQSVDLHGFELSTGYDAGTGIRRVGRHVLQPYRGLPLRQLPARPLQQLRRRQLLLQQHDPAEMARQRDARCTLLCKTPRCGCARHLHGSAHADPTVQR